MAPLNPNAAEFVSEGAPLNPKAPEFVSTCCLVQASSTPITDYCPISQSLCFFWSPFVQLTDVSAAYSSYHPRPLLPWQFDYHQQTSTVIGRARPWSTAAEKLEVRKKVNKLGINIERVKSRADVKDNKRHSKEGVHSHEIQKRKAWMRKSSVEDRSSERRVEGLDNEQKSEARDDDIERVKREDTRTTVMIKNIPNKFTREMLIKILDEHCMKENRKKETGNSREVQEESRKLEEKEKCGEVEEENEKLRREELTGEAEEYTSSAFDFLYLPMDFGSGCNKGYAFVNFTEPGAAWKFNICYHDHKWDVLHSKKICKITYARIQGKDRLVQHFQNSTFACASDDLLPVYFIPYRDGAGKAKQYSVGRRIAGYFWEVHSDSRSGTSK